MAFVAAHLEDPPLREKGSLVQVENEGNDAAVTSTKMDAEMPDLVKRLLRRTTKDFPNRKEVIATGLRKVDAQTAAKRYLRDCRASSTPRTWESRPRRQS